MMTEQNPVVSFRAGRIPALRSRTGRLSAQDVAVRDLERYYESLRRSLPTFEQPEASLIVDALNGSLMDAGTAHLLWAEIDDAIRSSGLARKWGVLDGAGLVNRLRQMTPFEQLAIVDAAERFWLMPARDIGEALREIGLVTHDDAL